MLAGTPVLHRVHCSLNLNTETGRLSARRPNLQNSLPLRRTATRWANPDPDAFYVYMGCNDGM